MPEQPRLANGQFTYWHVADRAYQAGDDLLSRDELGDDAPEWHWPEVDEADYVDSDVVSLFASEEDMNEAIDAGDFPNGGRKLRVDIPEDRSSQLTHISEGYPAYSRKIPAEWITEIGDV